MSSNFVPKTLVVLDDYNRKVKVIWNDTWEFFPTLDLLQIHVMYYFKIKIIARNIPSKGYSLDRGIRQVLRNWLTILHGDVVSVLIKLIKSRFYICKATYIMFQILISEHICKHLLLNNWLTTVINLVRAIYKFENM